MKEELVKIFELERESIDDLMIDLNDASREAQIFLLKRSDRTLESDSQHVYAALKEMDMISSAIDRKPLREKLNYYRDQIKSRDIACKAENYEIAQEFQRDLNYLKKLFQREESRVLD